MQGCDRLTLRCKSMRDFPKRRRPLVGIALPLALTVAWIANPACAEAPTPPSSAAAPVAGWDGFVDSLRGLPERMLAKLPAEQRSDPQLQQEIGRLALSALASSAIEAIGSDPAHPVFLPSIGQVLSTGQPNADTVYRVARIAPEGVYRLRGLRGSLRMFNISQSPPSPADPEFKPGMKGPRPRHDFSALKVDGQGRFDVLLSPKRPAGYSGDWWQLEQTTHVLLLRMVSSDWHKEHNPTLSIERLDVPVARPRPTAADLQQRLEHLPRAIDFIAPLLLDRPEAMHKDGAINKLKVIDVTELGGLKGQYYYEGAYDLRDDEALIVETKVPEGCEYRSLILTNYIYETTDWYNNQSSLNDTQARPDEDGVLRIIVSRRDPGVPNWLDTAGYPQGAIQGRWAGCLSRPVPSVKKVALADVRKSLPPRTPTISPSEREQAIRERRSDLQQRPLW